MKTRIFFSILLTTVFTLLVASGAVIAMLYSQFSADIQGELMTEARYVARAVNSGVRSLDDIGRDAPHRLTLIAADGRVLYDNSANAGEMESHSGRPEVHAALETGEGESSRLSNTLRLRTFYAAVRLQSGDVVRLASMTRGPLGLLASSIPGIVGVLILAIIAALYVARRLTRALMEPVNAINLDDPLSNDTYDELSPLLLRLDHQNRRIAEQLNELTAKQRELDCITSQMAEGLIVIGGGKNILFANRSARMLFDALNSQERRTLHFMEVCRAASWLEAVEGAFAGQKVENRLTQRGRVYQLTASPAGEREGRASAVILFLVDITEREQAESLRREFAANVSHELKTPLTSIMGYAELMERGLARPEDMQGFAGRIRSEAARLLELIRDVITLSQLDEQDLRNRFTEVDLRELCDRVLDELASKAAQCQVTLHGEGPVRVVSGLKETLHELLFNLCDNAIVYNRPGGRVTVTIGGSEQAPVLTVSDTGVGIPPEHQSRIFERFYRVDASRSRTGNGGAPGAGGGSGLGLAIVKHAARLHGASVELESQVGKGTTLRVVWPEPPAGSKAEADEASL